MRFAIGYVSSAPTFTPFWVRPGTGVNDLESTYHVMGRLLTFASASSPARVLILTSGWPREGARSYGIFVQRQVDSLRRAGLDTDVLVVNGYRSTIAYAAAALWLVRASLRRQRRYDLVHAHGGEAGLAARFYFRAPMLVSYQGDDLLGTPGPDGTVPCVRLPRRAIIRALSRLAQATITKSEEMETVLPKRVRQRNLVLPNGVDTEIFFPTPRNDARRRLGWPVEARVALFVGDPRLPRKRYFLAHEAVTIASRRLAHVRLEVADSVPPPELPLIMSAADCLLLTSSIEGSPNVVKEALMVNLPVIATPVGDVQLVLRGVDPSYICEARGAALADALVACLTNPRRSNGRSRSQWLSSAAIARRLLALYAALGVTWPADEDVDDGKLTTTECG